MDFIKHFSHSNLILYFFISEFRSLRIPSFLIFGELDTNPGAGLAAAEELHALLSDRLSEVRVSMLMFMLMFMLMLMLFKRMSPPHP